MWATGLIDHVTSDFGPQVGRARLHRIRPNGPMETDLPNYQISAASRKLISISAGARGSPPDHVTPP